MSVFIFAMIAQVGQSGPAPAWWDSTAFLVGIVIAGVLLALLITLRGSSPDQRPKIIRALAELIRRGGSRRR